MEFCSDPTCSHGVVVLPEGFPVSAVATEYAVALRMIIAQGAQEAQHAEMAMAEGEVRAQWAKNVAIHAGCMVVTHATSKTGASQRDQRKYGGCYKH